MEKIANSDVNIVINKILERFYSLSDEKYFPIIIEDGRLISENGTELYAKVIAVRKNTEIKTTWMTGNLSEYFDNESNCFNLAVNLKYKYQNLVTLNPRFYSPDDISFCDQKSKDIFDLEYTSINSCVYYPRVLKTSGKNILLYFETIQHCTDYSDYSNEKFDFYLEFEYREFVSGLACKTEEKEISVGYYNLIYQKNDGIDKEFSKGRELYWLRGTVKINLDNLNCSKKKEQRIDNRFKVYDLEDRNFRALNLHNYDDDMNAGLLVFSLDAIDPIKEYFYFYGLELIPKIDNLHECLVDVHKNFLTFWEGEFNSYIPQELKEKLLKFNITDYKEHLLSAAMFDWQLKAQWDVYDKMLPNQQLARKILEKEFNQAKEVGIDFCSPRNISEYSVFVNSFKKLKNFKFEELHISSENIDLIKGIMDGTAQFANQEALYINFQGLCVLFLRVYYNE